MRLRFVNLKSLKSRVGRWRAVAAVAEPATLVNVTVNGGKSHSV